METGLGARDGISRARIAGAMLGTMNPDATAYHHFSNPFSHELFECPDLLYCFSDHLRHEAEAIVGTGFY